MSVSKEELDLRIDRLSKIASELDKLRNEAKAEWKSFQNDKQRYIFSINDGELQDDEQDRLWNLEYGQLSELRRFTDDGFWDSSYC